MTHLPSLLPPWRYFVIVLAPLLLLPLALMSVEARCGYVILVMAVYWMTEAIPIAITALIPVFAFPLLGVLSTADICLVYMKETNMMFLGGLTVAIAVEHCQLHKRVALFVILTLGQSPRRLMTGFMLTTMFLSMWISNTATTAMMVPIVDAVLQELYKTRSMSVGAEEDPRIAPHHQSKDPIASAGADSAVAPTYGTEGAEKYSGGGDNSYPPSLNSSSSYEDVKTPQTEDDETVLFAPPPNKECARLRDMCYLATAYSANLGGTGALTGTGPNLVVKAVMDKAFPRTNVINFATWLAYNVPGMLLCGALAWCWLHVLFVGVRGTMLRSDKQREAAVERVLRRKYRQLGAMSAHEVIVLVLFVALVLLWLFRSPGFMVGWADLLEEHFPDVDIADATPAMLVVILIFASPSKPRCCKCSAPTEELPGLQRSSSNKISVLSPDDRCLIFEAVKEKVQWGIMLILGSAYAVSAAADKSNLSALVGDVLQGLSVLPKEAIVFICTLLAAAFTEAVSSNTVSSTLTPVLAEMSVKMEVNPVYLMLPPAVACSFAFILPVATPPNAIIFNTSKIECLTMLKAGVVMNVICVLVSMLMINTLGVAMFDLNSFPDWAAAASNSSLV